MRPPRHHRFVNNIVLPGGRAPLTTARCPSVGPWCARPSAAAAYGAYCALMLALVLPVIGRGANTSSSSSTARALNTSSLGSTASDDPRAWLARTDEALASRNYRGVFVHELHGYGGEAETLEVIHRVGNDGVSERLVSMDGSGREFIRRNGELSCYL